MRGKWKMNRKQLKAIISLYGSLVLYFGIYSLFWMWVGYWDEVYREAYSFYIRGLLGGFVGSLAVIMFNLLIWNPDIMKDGGN